MPTRDGGGWLPALDGTAVVVLASAALWLRLPELGPSSLWQDDAWVVLGATRADGLGEVALSGVTAPGFSVLLSGWLAVAGDSSTAAQLLPLVFAVVASPVLYLVAHRLGAHRVVAGVTALALAVAPVHVQYATRVKQYSLDTLLAVVLLGLAWSIVDAPSSRRRWVTLTVTSVVAMVISASVLPVVAGAFAVAGLTGLRAGGAARRRAIVAGCTYGVVALLWALAVLAPTMNVPLTRFWSDYYLEVDDGVAPFVGSVGLAVSRMLGDVSDVPVLAGALIVVGFAWLVARRPWVALGLAVPVLVSVLMAAFHMAPLGGGRTDHHLLPSLVIAMGFALEPIIRLGPSLAATLASGAVAAVLAASASPPPPYPQQDLRPLSDAIDRHLGSDDTVLLLRPAEWLFGLYSDQPVEIVEDRDFIRGWRPAFPDPRVRVLGGHGTRPQRFRPEVGAAVDDLDGDGSLWLLLVPTGEGGAVVEDQLGREGLEVVEERRTSGGRLTRWVRGRRLRAGPCCRSG